MVRACSDAFVGKVSASEDTIVIGDFDCEFSDRTIFKLPATVSAADGTLNPVVADNYFGQLTTTLLAR